MKNATVPAPGTYKMPDGRTHTVLDVQNMKIDISQFFNKIMNLRIQELVKRDAKKEANNG